MRITEVGTQIVEPYGVLAEGNPADLDSYTLTISEGEGEISLNHLGLGSYNVIVDPDPQYTGCITFSILGYIGETAYTEEWSAFFCERVPVLHLWRCKSESCSCCNPSLPPEITESVYCPSGNTTSCNSFRVKSCHPFKIRSCEKFCVFNPDVQSPTIGPESIYIYLRKYGSSTMSRIIRIDESLLVETGCATFDIPNGLAAGWWQAQVAVEDTGTGDIIRLNDLNRFFVEPCLTSFSDTGCLTTTCVEPS